MYSQETLLERSRLDGMVVGGVTFGIFLILTIQSLVTLIRRPLSGGKILDHRLALVFYVVITFILGTISFSANAKFTQMIWIDLRDVPGGPFKLIENEMNYHINALALSSGHIQEWFMQALLLHRCFAIWNWTRWVVIPMTTLFFAMIALSILIQVEASIGTTFYDINTELAYLCIQVGITVIYTALVAYRLLAMRRNMKQALAQFDCSIYNTILIMVIESAVSYSIFAIIFIVAFALHYNVISTLCFLSIGQLQGIAQLFIIIRVASGREVTHEWATPVAVHTTMAFSGSASDTTEESNDGEMDRSEQGIASEKVPEALVAAIA